MEGKRLELFIDGQFDQRVLFTANKIINAGYTGRNQEEVRKHIEELKLLGVPAPDQVPTYYPKPAALLTSDESIEIADTDNTGEAEYVLLIGENETVYVAAGSDHTDRKLEGLNNILKAKQMCPNFISKAVWRLEDVETHWDDIIIRSWVNGHSEAAYQESKLSAMMGPRELIERVKPLVAGPMAGTVIYSGTVGTLGEIKFNNRFEMELVDKVRGQRLYCGYYLKLINWFAGC
ncbi:hypothetical protein Psch_04171 [Pelotomaculum schinkii]|uniref:DUF2848 domain-containing protein n=1 Tax=Pelotomaculum schinkii TaxID=78350 RepID=A0A4Y7R656_9FIRM|nr:DUF2848 family protein [Pelotomaculum schinkii]TEB04444.1 hypothetical protein Psch_04171 [Pelotomaculum schinkii]